jgi:MoaA/NifB/PqqE/SkfB family radical SAM enzyme
MLKKSTMRYKKRKITCVMLETSTTCNAKCKFCPTNRLKPEIMPQTLFYKIINDLAQMNFSGKILPYNRNEPLTDPFIFERLRYIREKLPKSKIFFSTNGFLLNEDKIEKLLDLQPIDLRISIHAFLWGWIIRRCFKIYGFSVKASRRGESKRRPENST